MRSQKKIMQDDMKYSDNKNFQRKVKIGNLK